MSEETSSSTGAEGPGDGSTRDGSTTGAPSRRAVLGWGGAGLALGAAAAGGSVAALRGGTETVPAGMSGAAVPFHGAHQAGIASAVQDRLHFAAFDVTT
ncbi:deferrochelatase/peroxidase EfeB, partial [Streptomyces goshikiensis]